jgi:hypothetical protein
MKQGVGAGRVGLVARTARPLAVVGGRLCGGWSSTVSPFVALLFVRVVALVRGVVDFHAWTNFLGDAARRRRPGSRRPDGWSAAQRLPPAAPG